MLVRPSRQPLSDRCQTLAANAQSMLSHPEPDRLPASEPFNGLYAGVVTVPLTVGLIGEAAGNPWQDGRVPVQPTLTAGER
jgi:hypothetical protein